MANRETRFPNGVTAPTRASNAVTQGSDTLTAAECVIGKTFFITGTTAQTIVLPILTGVVGGQVTIVNDVDGQLLTIDPNAADGIAFGGNVTDGKSIVNTAATAKKGDYVTLITQGSVTTGVANYWTVAEVGGVWADGS